VLFSVLNDEFVAGLAGLVYQLVYRGHILFCVRASGLPLLCFQFQLVHFLKTNISQGSVATSFRHGGICNDRFIVNIAVECIRERSLKIGQHLAKMWTKV